jgi:hypothetical protein
VQTPTPEPMFMALGDRPRITCMQVTSGWLVTYSPIGGWVSVIPAPGCSSFTWLVPGWRD